MNSYFSVEDLLARADKGTAAWWQYIAAAGTPLQKNLASGEIELTFLWRDPEGGATTSDYQRVYLDIYSHTPHPTQQLTSMIRQGYSDIWLWQTQLPGDWCGSYFLMPAKTHQLPPESGDRKMLRRWWIDLMASNAQADILNPLPSHSNGGGLYLSRIQLPQANVHRAWQLPSAPLKGKYLQQHWRSERLNNERCIWIYATDFFDTQEDLPLVIFLDGHYWAHHMPIFSALDLLTSRAELPPAVYLFVDALNPAQRAQELPCNADFWLALQQELLPQVFAVQAFTDQPQRTLIAGQSFGGLAALYAALNWPNRFGIALSQSGSFWWPDADETGAEGLLTRDVIAGLGKDNPLTVSLDVGCYEPDMIGVNQAMCDALKDAGHSVSYREFRGGHDWICWRDGLLSGLGRLLNSLPIGSNPP